MNGIDIANKLMAEMTKDYRDELIELKSYVEHDTVVNNPVISILEYNRIGANSALTGDAFRLKYDADARYFNSLCDLSPDKALFGDTMISFWTPYKRLLQKRTGEGRYYRYAHTYENVTKLINRQNDERIKQINEELRDFAEVYHSPGNFLFLPERKMNTARFSYKRVWMEDRIDKTLYECFAPDGLLCEFFGKNNNNLIKWIKKEKLDSEILFKGGDICQKAINPLCGKWLNDKEFDFMNYYAMVQNEDGRLLETFLDNVVELIKYRNDVLCEKERCKANICECKNCK